MKEYKKLEFGKTKDGEKVDLIVLENDLGDKLELIPYGARIVALKFNENGTERNIVLERNSVKDYENGGGSLGATVGPIANRIKNAEFRFQSNLYVIEKNEGNNVVHSGDLALDYRLWDIDEVSDHEVVFSIRVNEDNYPGDLRIKVRYSFSNDRKLYIDYEATSSEDTYVNLTNHSYFNISDAETIKDLFFELNADFYTPIDDELIPTGEIAKVEGTQLDFRKLKSLKDYVEHGKEMFPATKGIDHNFVLNKEERNELSYAARLVDKETGKQLVCFTDCPGIQVYTANLLDDYECDSGRKLGEFAGICLETQFFPDFVNRAHFPAPLLKAGDEYKSSTVYVYTDWKEDFEEE